MELNDPNQLPGNSGEDRLSFVVCRSGQGAEVRGTLHRLTRFVAVFEVYNPYSILQLSEVLTDFRVFMNDRVVYSARAVIANLVNTGIMVICEASLTEEGWIDIDLFSPVHKRDSLLTEFEAFIRDTSRVHHVAPEFKVIVADVQIFLSDLRRWMEQVELSVRSLPPMDRIAAEREVLSRLEPSIVANVLPVMQRVESVAAAIPEDLKPVHRSYIKRLIHPIILCSPFVFRTYHKPLGYAGDYEMVSMMLRDPFEGSTLFAKMLNKLCLEIPPVIAHRNRIDYLRRRLNEECARTLGAGRVARIYNLGCGPAQEVQRFIDLDEMSDNADFLLLDFNDETVAHATRVLEEARMRHRRRTALHIEKKSVQQVLKEGMRPDEKETGTFDLVYCAGLFDYLSDRVCKRLISIFYDKVAPGGLMIATNVHPNNPWRQWMEYLGDWHLVYRTEEDFIKLAPDKAPPGTAVVTADSTGLNVFLEVRKPADA